MKNAETVLVRLVDKLAQTQWHGAVEPQPEGLDFGGKRSATPLCVRRGGIPKSGVVLRLPPRSKTPWSRVRFVNQPDQHGFFILHSSFCIAAFTLRGRRFW